MGDADLTVFAGIPNQAPYSISKAAVNMVVAKYAAEYKAEGFVFLALSPGLVDTTTKARESHLRFTDTHCCTDSISSYTRGGRGLPKNVDLLPNLVS